MGELILLLSILFIFLFIGVPVAFALGATAVIGIIVFLDVRQLAQVVSITYIQGTSMALMVAPLFILMSELLSHGGMAKDIFGVLSKWLKKIPGSLAVSNIFACSIFAALCGSSPVTAATLGKISIPEMENKGYNRGLSIGSTVAGGTIGILIPPSLSLIVYGIITETSISKLLVAGIIPGVLLTVMFAFYILVRVKLNPGLVQQLQKNDGLTLSNEESSFMEDALRLFPSLFLIITVLGLMYLGYVTPTEAAGIGALGAFLILLLMGRLTRPILKTVLMETAKTTSMLLFLVINGLAFAYLVSSLGLPQEVTGLITDISSNKWITLLLVYLLWLALGTIMDPMSMVVVTMPFLFSPLVSLGFDPVWIGVAVTIAVEIGMITPPVGLNLFVVKGITDAPFEEIMSAAWPFLLVMLLFYFIVTVFPGLVMYLPNTM